MDQPGKLLKGSLAKEGGIVTSEHGIRVIPHSAQLGRRRGRCCRSHARLSSMDSTGREQESGTGRDFYATFLTLRAAEPTLPGTGAPGRANLPSPL